MAKILFKGGEVNTNGDLPKVGSVAPNFTLVNTGLADVSLADYKGKNVVLSINPSLDTSVCAATARKFNTTLSQLANTVVLYITKDLPFAHNRFCTTEGIENVVTLSDYRNPEFATTYGVLVQDGALKGLMARAIVVINPQGVVTYTEMVPEITTEPNYDNVIAALK
ncbi:MAG: thiol peroxidase [Bacteroidales bacterium]|jgi:thiol peroxidase|nr:thiol peroxidase [Paludibacteraceae bacterium]NLK91912.1 thiol peroxidase [Bacteroidales bacterium]MBP8628112.1 thiol peroxidase [Paludibacteraceae bacterium]MBP9648609.1 thiol peroxidase [Paludibacteraceae bacterium]MBP9970881.1 thiol peroxidase [Paludibacteraceae bacterium]